MALKNLNELKSSLVASYKEFKGEDCTLPQSFKEYAKQIANCNMEYHDYSVIAISTSKPYPKTYIPNQWFYIAQYFVEYIDAVAAYRAAAMEAYKTEFAAATTNPAKENVCSQLKSAPIESVRERFKNQNKYSDEETEYLVKFVTDYEWWSGGKAFCRTDSVVSPVLGMANVVNQNSTFIADICKFLSSDTKAYCLLKYPNAICVHTKLTSFFIEVFNHLYQNENRMLSIFENLQPGQPGSTRYAFVKDSMRQTNFFVKGDENFIATRKGDFYDKPFEYKGENYYVSLELAKSRPNTKNEVSFDGLKEVIESLYPNYRLIYENSTYIFVGIIKQNMVKPLQQIFYGAPGTGKSYQIDNDTNENNRIRTTFHPDYDYATFVGCYKPTVKVVDKVGLFGKDTVALKHEDNTPIKEEVIVYSFVPQSFTKAYVEAWRRFADPECSDKNYYLVIEEINRGNCAQIFGDLFQLLDRTRGGYSSYAVEADTDLQQFLATDNEWKLNITLTEDIKNDDKRVIAKAEDVMSGKVLVLPPNLHIWATMNTSDQSLFPIDSAFKRRWDWVYIPINIEAKTGWHIDVNDKKYKWSSFLEKINNEIEVTTSSEDKQLGFFFCKAEETDANGNNGKITAERFVSKVLFYLYNDVFKDYGLDQDFFKDKVDGKPIAFRSLFKMDGSLNEERVEMLLENLGVEEA